MRDILKKATTGAMIAGAALLVAACGGDTEANNATTDLGNVEDMTNMDTGMDNMTVDNMTVDTNNVTIDTNTTDTNTADTNTAE